MNVAPSHDMKQDISQLTSKPTTESGLAKFSRMATEWAGGSTAFAFAVATIGVWVISGPFFGFSDTWQLVINTGTTIVTFLMVFLIQRSQNKDAQAIHLKLNEIVASIDGSSNRLINAEKLSEEDLNVLHDHYCKLVELAKEDNSLTKSHSIDEAQERHDRKSDKDTPKNTGSQ
jgi:low affinity Fe/Cu permease